ncbi:hypothetical protein [Paraglaciecola arctica]|uniref:hypothetical protein n=1 Tax=Paraglaciecola arctica TaxID=1128911 RepID=UPI001C07A5EB|nr:hypothetical protein [Paraglaciecola arctica]MBU3004229.1 hypothetical protein [Paraglaciecola arctica]
MKIFLFRSFTILLLVVYSGLLCANTNTTIPQDAAFSVWLEKDFSPEKNLFTKLRHGLITGEPLSIIEPVNIPFDPSYAIVGVTLFQTGNQPLRYLSKRGSLELTINRIIKKLRQRNRFSEFDIKNDTKTRILLEIITEELPVDFNDITFTAFSSNRFEPGITGLRIKPQNGSSIHFMPTDSAVYSHMSARQVFNAIAKKTPIGKITNKISERINMLKHAPYEFFLTKSVAFISEGNAITPLFRGYPVPVDSSKENFFNSTKQSVDWLIDNMDSEGKFLYYYDGIEDTIVDHDHPNRSKDNLYYNSLRHSGGTITLLRMYELSKDKKYLTAGKQSLNFLLKNLKQREIDGENAYYLFYNNKSKLGGTGVGLVAFMRYYMLTGDDSYNEIMAGMVRHLLSRIDENGEFIGYYIHPQFNGGNPLDNPSNETKKQLFSFYYPGEALMGLALYAREMPISAAEKSTIKQSSMKAMDWLVSIRPKKYPEFFKPLPSDGWLMQAIEEWSMDPDFMKKPYIDFVFNDAKQMISHMYKKESSPYYDYPGAFYYNYGDHAYVDGARAEGLIAAYYLAKRLGNKELSQYLFSNIETVAKSLLYTYNSKQSSYMYIHPEKALGAFRFKYTRQWMRVDSVQHTACFLIRLMLAPPPEK